VRNFILIFILLIIATEAEAEDLEPIVFNHLDGYVNAVAISDDGEYLAAVTGVDGDGVYLFHESTTVWEYHAGDPIQMYQVSITADGEYIVAGANGDGYVYLFHKDNGTPLWVYDVESYLTATTISADGNFIVAASYDGIYLFSKDSNTPLWFYETDYLSSFGNVAISDNGDYIVLGSSDSIYLFSKDNSTPLWNYTAGGYVYSLDITANGEYIAAGKNDAVYLFSKDNGTPIWIYETYDIRSVSISANGTHIVAGSNKGNLSLFNKEENNPLWNWNYTIEADYVIVSTGISDSGEYILMQTSEYIYLFSSDNGIAPLWRYVPNENEIIGFADISADGEYIILSSHFGISLILNNLSPFATIDNIVPSSGRFDTDIFIFSGTGYDNDGTITAYEWSSSIEGILSNQTDFNTTNLAIGTHVITFRVQDNDGVWSEFTKVLVVYGNAPPTAIIDFITPATARFDSDFTFHGTGSDSDGHIEAYQWSSTVDGVLSDKSNFNITGLSSGYHTITLRVEDNDGDWSETDAELVVIGNKLPVAIITSDYQLEREEHFYQTGQMSHEHFLIVEGTKKYLFGNGTDSDGYITNYSWHGFPDGTNLSTISNKNLDLSILPLGHYSIWLIVTDNDGYESYSNTIYVQVNPSNSINISPSVFGIIGLGLIGLFYKKRIEKEIKARISPVNLKALKISVIISSGINLIIYMHDCSVGHCPGNSSDIPLWFGALVITVICYSITRYFVDKFPDGNWLAPTAGILGIILLIAMVSLSDEENSGIEESSESGDTFVGCFEGNAEDKWCYDSETEMCVFYGTYTETWRYKEAQWYGC